MTEDTVTDGRAPRTRRWSPVWALLLLVALAVTTAGIFPLRQILAQQDQVEATRAKLDALTSETDRLQGLVDALHTDAEVERLARERFGLVRPGEVGYSVEWAGEIDEVAGPPALAKDERPWYRKVWDYVSGAEYEPDG